MNRIFKHLRRWLASRPAASEPVDPVSRMSQRELADLPAWHPLPERR